MQVITPAGGGGGGGGSGTVTSVGLVAPSGIFTVSGSPVTIAGNITIGLVDPGVDRLVFWDDSAGDLVYLTVGSGLSIVGTTITATAGSGDVVGPASAVDSQIAAFDGTTGKLIKDGGTTIAAINSSIAGKEPTIAAGTTAQYWRGDKSWQTLDKTAVGLANVDNTSDVNKPVSTAQATADALRILGPGTVVSGRTVVFSGTTGLAVAQSSRLEADLVAGPASSVTNRIATFNGTGGKTIQDGGSLISDLATAAALTSGLAGKQDLSTALTQLAGLGDPGVDTIVFWDDSASSYANLTIGTNLSITGTTLNASGGGGVAWGAISGTLSSQTDLQTALDAKVTGPASVTDSRVTAFDGTTGKLVKQGTQLVADLVTGPASVATTLNIAVFSGTTGKIVADGGKTIASLDTDIAAKIAGPGTVVSGRTVVFSGTTGLVVSQSSRLEADLVAGPASSTSGRIAVWNGAGGKTLQDGTKLEADVVTGPASAVTARVATFNGTTGKIIQDGGTLLADLVVGPASVVTGRVASYNGTTGKLIADGGILVADVVTGPASAVSARVATFNGTSGKIIQDGGTLLSALATLASPTFTGTPAAPTATFGTDTTQLATTAFVQDAIQTMPGRSVSAATTTIAADAGGVLLHPSADTTARIWTIDSNANVPYPLYTPLTFINQNAAGVITIAITSDTLRLAGAGTTGSRTLAANGVATAVKVGATEWIINGTGLT